MAKARVTTGLMVGLWLLWGGGATARAADPPTVPQMLGFRPQQAGVVCSTPTPEEQKDCKVKLEQGKRPGSSGWILLDAKGQHLRRFFDSDGDKQIDIWSYYKDGVEVYRESDTKKARRPDQFRWLHSGGSKWGVDLNGDGKIDTWKIISAEEVAQEAFQAVAARDFARLRALLISDAEIAALKLPATQTKQLRDTLSGAQAKFTDTAKKLPQIDAQAHYLRVESGPPHCIPADASGADQDLLQYPSRSILYEIGDKEKKHDWLHTGPMVLVGQAWRLIDAPSPAEGTESLTEPARSGPNIADSIDPEMRKLLDLLDAHDKKVPAPSDKAGLVRYNLARADLCRQIAAKAKADDSENWLKQVADCLNSAAQNSGLKDRTALQQLAALKVQVAKTAGNSNLVAYVTYREIWAEYGPQIGPDNENRPKIQEAHDKMHERLIEFVKQFSKAEDTPDALMQLAMNSEFSGKEDEAKRWYKMIADNFAQHQLLAARAAGAIRRLELVGQPMELAGPTLGGANFNLANLKGKVIVVYYWASYGQPAEDFKHLTKIRDKFTKDLEVVTVNLDERAADAQQCLQKSPLAVPHLFDGTEEKSGLNSGLATQYGIQGIPTLFLIGKDGRVISRTLQIDQLEREIEKAVK